MIRFVRVTYVRPSDDLTSSRLLAAAFASSPSGFSYKTILPAPVKVGMCSGSPVYENLTSTCERAKIWLRCVGTSFCYYFALLDVWIIGYIDKKIVLKMLTFARL